MNVVEKAGKKTGSDLRPNAVDFERFRLRRFIESLGDAELETRSEPVDLAGIAEVMEGNQKAVLFRAAGPEQAELVGNVMGGRSRIAAASIRFTLACACGERTNTAMACPGIEISSEYWPAPRTRRTSSPRDRGGASSCSLAWSPSRVSYAAS